MFLLNYANDTLFVQSLYSLLKEIFSAIYNKQLAMVKFDQLNCHLPSQTHTSSSNYYKAICRYFDGLLKEKMDSTGHMGNNDNGDKSRNTIEEQA
jgi:hypothetical protein